jgi:hypothetical protein
MIPLLQQTFSAFIPPLEKVLETKLKNTTLQVIVKIGSIDLSKPEGKSKYPGGSWHIEGMPYEHIAATCIHYLDIQNITESFLEFRKPVIFNDENSQPEYPQNDSSFTTHHYGIEPDSHHQGFMNRYIGLIRCKEGSSVIFPNTLQHKVKDFELLRGAKHGIRTIVAFFVIDPRNRIVSTKDVDVQTGVISRQEAEYHRERLMYHRKYFVSLLNKEVFERPYSLCEH